MDNMGNWYDLDSDTQIQILKKLPFKTLIRLMCTSRSMFSLITSPAFMISSNPRKTLYHIYSYNFTPQGDQNFLLWKDSEKDPMKTRKITSSLLDFSYSFIGSCDGLLCFNNSLHPYDQRLVFWNPFLGRFLTLPMPPMPAQRCCALGFGFDRSKIDYKVVRIGILAGYYECCKICADIFMLFDGTWKKGVGYISGHASRIMGRGVYVNGVLHWILERKECGDTNYSILTFNLGSEVFGEVAVPEGIGQRSMVLTTLTLSGGEKLIVYPNDQICNIWVMEEYGGSTESWRKLCTIDVGTEYATVLNAMENGEIVVSTTQGRLLRYNPNSQELTNIRLHPASPLDYVGPCIESLVFPHQHHGAIGGRRLQIEEERSSGWKNGVKLSSTASTSTVDPLRILKLIQKLN